MKPKPKGPRPASTYRGARRNALKAGAKLVPHRWQTKRPTPGSRTPLGTLVLDDGTLDYSFKGVIRPNEKVRA
jgi:hypothetical protein